MLYANCDLIDSVLATLLKNKVVPDPFYGLENETIIDIADSGREYYTFWFFTTFQCKLVSYTPSPFFKLTADWVQVHIIHYAAYFCEIVRCLLFVSTKYPSNL